MDIKAKAQSRCKLVQEELDALTSEAKDLDKQVLLIGQKLPLLEDLELATHEGVIPEQKAKVIFDGQEKLSNSNKFEIEGVQFKISSRLVGKTVSICTTVSNAKNVKPLVEQFFTSYNTSLPKRGLSKEAQNQLRQLCAGSPINFDGSVFTLRSIGALTVKDAQHIQGNLLKKCSGVIKADLQKSIDLLKDCQKKAVRNAMNLEEEIDDLEEEIAEEEAQNELLNVQMQNIMYLIQNMSQQMLGS